MPSRNPPATPVKPTAPTKKPAKRRAKTATGADATQGLVAATPVPSVSADERRGLIARAAYLRGERRGFPPGGEAEDWLAAEKEVDALLSGGYRADQ